MDIKPDDNFDSLFSDPERLRSALLLKLQDPDAVDRIMEIYKMQYPVRFKS